MSRKSLLTALATALLLVGGSAAVLVFLLRHEPTVFKRGLIAPGPLRLQRSGECLTQLNELFEAITAGQEREWDIRLTDQQINSFFAEGFKKSTVRNQVLPDGVSEPRVAFEPGRIRIAFRWGKGLWSTVVSLDLGIWLTEETNVVAVEIQRIRAGSLPIGAHALLDSLSDMCENNGIQVKWYRYHGNPVALLRFGTQRKETTVQLHTLHVDHSGMVIRGRPVGNSAARAASVALEATSDQQSAVSP